MREPRKPEIGDPEVLAGIDQEIRRLDVAMNHTDLVCMLKRKSCLESKSHNASAVLPIVERRPCRARRGRMNRVNFKRGIAIGAFGIGKLRRGRHGAKAPDDLGQRSTHNELHGVIMDALVAPDAEYRHDMLVVQ